MEKKLTLRLLAINFIFVLPVTLIAQEWQEIKSVKFKKNVSSYAVDIKGDFYFGFKDGSLTKYSGEGNLLENFSLSNTSSITLIDAQNNLKPFVFHFDNQQITILDRFSSIPKIYDLVDFGVQIGMLSCPAPDGDLWVVENNPQRLKKINPQRKSLVLEVQIALGDSLTKMQAYQNLLLISNSKSLYALDQFGGQLYQLTFEELKTFQVENNFLYAITKTGMIKYHPFTGQKIESLSLPGSPTEGVLKSKNQIGILSETNLVIYKIDQD